MVKKVVVKGSLGDTALRHADIEYWSSRDSKERIETVELLRRQNHGSSERLQRTARVIERA